MALVVPVPSIRQRINTDGREFRSPLKPLTHICSLLFGCGLSLAIGNDVAIHISINATTEQHAVCFYALLEKCIDERVPLSFIERPR